MLISKKHARLTAVARPLVLALAVLALLALASLRLSKGERLLPPPDSVQTVDVRPSGR
jgi:hypothetical protein